MTALVLISESDPFNLRLVQEVCEAAGHEVVTACEGAAVLELVARKRPDLVLLDISLAMHGVATHGLAAVHGLAVHGLAAHGTARVIPYSRLICICAA